MSDKTTIKAKFWSYTQSGGDGSAFPRFFNSEEATEAYAADDDERFTDDINVQELEFDQNGKLLTPNPTRD